MHSKSKSSENFGPQSPRSSQAKNTSTTTTSNDHLINRLAILPASLGCPYDVPEDAVFQTLLSYGRTTHASKSYESVDCFIMKHDSFNVEDLFRKIGISDDIWLNLMLNIATKEGIGYLVDYPFLKNANTRYFYYYYSNHQKYLSDDQNVAKKDMPHDKPNINATHIISSIKFGICIVVILELPPDNHEKFDQLLDEVKVNMTDNGLHLSNEEKTLLNRIHITKVFSNIPELREICELYDICQMVTKLKQLSYRHRPLEYTLQSIRCFYSSYSSQKAKYIPLEKETLKIIMGHVRPLHEAKLTLETQRNEHHSIIEKVIVQVEEVYSATIKKIANLVVCIRRGKINHTSIIDILQEKTNESLYQNIEFNLKQINFTIEKIQFINELRKENIQYMNMEQYYTEGQNDLNSILSQALEKNNFYLVFCSTDDLKELDQSTWQKSYKNWNNKREKYNSSVFVYADFSYTSYSLSTTKIILLNGKNPISNEDLTSITESKQFLDNKPQEYIEVASLAPVLVHEDNGFDKSSETIETLNTSLLQNQKTGESEDSQDIWKTSIQTIMETTSSSQLEHSDQPASSTDKLDISVSSSEKPIPQPRKSRQSKIENHNTNDSKSIIQSQPGGIIETNEELNDIKKHPTDEFESSKPIDTEKSILLREESTKIQSASLVAEKRAHSPLESLDHDKQQNRAARERRRRKSKHTPNIKYINILLLGPSGVGKSTFINALVNYYAFKTLKEARSNLPHVVMPVSFLLTVGDQFEERKITFGDEDSNEDHHHPGQSVTQYCRSYVFLLDSQTELRIIDTPGMGDTRGIDQDDINMQRILLFINKLSHLNAICILLKPNESRLNVVLRSYFTRLLNFLGENACKNIVFCFTNTRSTFYAPGDTGPLLRKMIKNLPIQGIQFQKSNTFCFDSESFRYLIALNNGVEFDAFEREEYEKSWQISTAESQRLIDYICQNLEPTKEEEWQSIEHVQFKIKELIRPLLETARNCSRNFILLKEKSSNFLIELNPTPIKHSSYICYQCKRTPQQFDDFQILPDNLHSFTNECDNCKCPKNKHTIVKYALEYKLVENPEKICVKDLFSIFDQLKKAFQQIAQFYASTIENIQENDPILPALKRMIAEEHQLSACRFNSILHQLFNNLLETYENNLTNSESNKLSVDLLNVYEHIKEISDIKEIRKQLLAMKQTEEIFMKEHEKQVL